MTITPTTFNRLRLSYLMLVTASAIVTTDYLCDRNCDWQNPALFLLLFLGGWFSVIVAWRRHRPHLRYWSGILTFFVVASELIGVSWLRFRYFPCSPSPAERQYWVLKSAIERHDLGAVQAILVHDSNPDFVPTNPACDFDRPCTRFERPLETAVVQAQVQIAALLLDRGASIANGQFSLLRRAGGPNDIAMMRLLLHHGAPVNDLSGNSSALWTAVSMGRADTVAFLLQHGANSNSRGYNDGKLCSALKLARSKNTLAIVQLLLHAGATE